MSLFVGTLKVDCVSQCMWVMHNRFMVVVEVCTNQLYGCVGCMWVVHYSFRISVIYKS